MPTLHWLGKEKVINHHHDVPFRVLEPQYTFGDADDSDGSRIIHGDNLEALKALLPQYENRIKCIYIDPPYNTGNENWVYNDNVNDPKIRRWLGKVVGKESEDLSRHDKWLCMMYPRLQLLHRLLAEDGAIFVSIDDNEQASLKLVMDEIWGRGNFLGSIVWQKKQSPQNDAINLSDMHDFLVAYAKRVKQNKHDTKGFSRKLIPKSKEQVDRYKNPDNDYRGPWTSGDITSNKTRFERPNLYYPVINPITQEEIYPSEKTVWRYDKDRLEQLVKENRIWWGKDGKGFPRLKNFLNEVADGVVPSTWWTREFAGDNQEARRLFRSIFQNVEDDFSTPKPTRLIERILQIATGPNDIILDSFAGSGTTAHAVLNLNKQDAGNRKFILVEMEEYAETITAERVRRVIGGYADKEGTGGGFTYYELGPTLFTEDNLLNEELPVERFREYIWYSETRQPLPQLAPRLALATAQETHAEAADETPYFLGSYQDTAYYFVYERDTLTTLDYDLLSTLRTRAGQYVIYADNCLIPREWLHEHRIVFRKTPRDIARL